MSEKRLTMNRNDYILNLAAVNAHHQRYYSTDLPEVIAVSDLILSIYIAYGWTTIVGPIENQLCFKLPNSDI